MINLATILNDWEVLEKRSHPKWALWLYFVIFTICYFFLLWKSWQAMSILLSVFKIRLESALGYYAIKMTALFFYYLLFWAFVHFIIFFILNPFFYFSSLGMMKREGDFAEKLKLKSSAFVIAFFSILLSFNPFFLPLSFLVIATEVFYLHRNIKFSFKHLLTNWRRVFKEGLYFLSLTLIPGLNIFLLPHDLVKKGET